MRRNIFSWMAVTLIAAAALFMAMVWYGKGPGRFDTSVAKNIRKLCGERPNCQVRLRDLFSDSEPWDRVYEFDAAASQNLITEKVGEGVAARDMQRTIVLMKGGYVVYQEHAPQPVEAPLADEVFLDCPDKNTDWIMCRADALLDVTETSGAASQLQRPAGRYYELKLHP